MVALRKATLKGCTTRGVIKTVVADLWSVRKNVIVVTELALQKKQFRQSKLCHYYYDIM
jgi:hypothetical protein